MIRFIGKLQGFSRKIIVAGEMLELGTESAELHQACGREAAVAGADIVIGVQGNGERDSCRRPRCRNTGREVEVHRRRF